VFLTVSTVSIHRLGQKPLKRLGSIGGVEVDLKKRTISVDSALYDRVSAIAKKKHIRTNELLSRWIKEKLRDAA